MSQTPKTTRNKKLYLDIKMHKSHSFNAMADLKLPFSKFRRPKSKKEVYQSKLADMSYTSASRAVSDDSTSVDSLDLDISLSYSPLPGVQRLELSEVAAGISKLSHAESDEQLNQSNEQSTLSRIEKLFPHDDLELNSSADKKPRRRRSAPSQILLKNLYRRSGTGDEVGMSRVPPPSSEVPVTNSDFVSRKFICESAVQLSAGVQTQQRYIFLFNDLLFIAKQRSSTSYKLKNKLLVSELWVTDYIAGVSESTADPTKSFVIGWPTTNYIATFSTKELCDRWKDKLRQQISEEQSKDLSSEIPVTVVHKNTLQEHMSDTIFIERDTDAEMLLDLTIKKFEIQNAKDTEYRLWVMSPKDESFYPLFGHEQPFAIQISHDRDAEDLDSSIKCQFILRENKKQVKTDRKPQKSGKKKKLPLSNIFRKASGKLPLSPRSTSICEGKLFGHPLDEICDPDIPTPLMELLETLYNSGPFTTEIFRKPANAKRCQDMVNRMNSSEPEGWCNGCHNGILLASVLKTYLRELPGKLCCSEYYGLWSDAIYLSNHDDRKSSITKIVETLPRGNQLVLRHIICILHYIQDNSEYNYMTSSNLAVCLGPSLLANESLEKSEQEASLKTVPQIVQYLIDNCQSVFGKDILDTFGHLPIEPVDSDTEEVSTNSRLLTIYNDSLESLSDTEGESRKAGTLTQMSPSSCSRDSGLILSDPHEGEHSDEHSLRQEIIKSKSCDSISQPEQRSIGVRMAPLQTQVSSDSLDCDDEYGELGNDCTFLLTKSKSGGHLCFDRNVEKSSVRIPSERHANPYPINSTFNKLQEVEYSSSDSEDKPSASNEQKQWLNTELQKSSTNSSLQQGSSSSDDIHGQEFVTHRHINSPKFFESENGHHPRDFLQQFTNKIESEELQKKRLRELVRQKTEPLLNTDTDDDDILRSAKSSSTSKNFSGRHLKHSSSTSKASPKIVRTNTYGGRGDRRQRAPDVSMLPNMAETKPIMPQQYRPNRPPPYREALERKEKMKCNVSEMEKIKQTVNSARAKQMYAQSVHLFEQGAKASTTSSSVPHAADVTDSKLSQASLYNNNNTIGVVNTQDTKFIFKRSAKPVNVDSTSRTIFYQPNSSHRIAAHPKSSANLFYRPTQPPPYKEAVKIRNNKPDLIDRLGGESLV